MGLGGVVRHSTGTAVCLGQVARRGRSSAEAPAVGRCCRGGGGGGVTCDSD